MSIEKYEFNAKSFVQNYFTDQKPVHIDFAGFKRMKKARKKQIIAKQASGMKGFVTNYFQKTR